MAEFKCNKCGGSIQIIDHKDYAVCEYCGSRQTLPKLNTDSIARRYERAGSFRRSNDFDKAAALYEEILLENDKDPEAYWSLVLCKYGIEYVVDPKTKRRVPTVHRMQYTSVLDDENYKSALKFAAIAQRSIYETEAREINEIHKGIQSISNNVDPYDIFICYKETDQNGQRTPDSVEAQRLYDQLIREGYDVFFSRITLEGKLGIDYEPYIYRAINTAEVMLVFGTRPEYFEATWVKNEWSRFLPLMKESNGKKKLIPVCMPGALPDELSHLQAIEIDMDDRSNAWEVRIRKAIHGIIPTETLKHTGSQANEHDANEVNNEVTSQLTKIEKFLLRENWNDAFNLCQVVFKYDPKNAKASLYQLMAQAKVSDEIDLNDCTECLDEFDSYYKAIECCDEATADRLASYNSRIKKRLKAEEDKKNAALQVSTALALAKQKKEQEQREQERAEKERLERERAEKERLERERAEKERLEQEQREWDLRLARERWERESREAEEKYKQQRRREEELRQQQKEERLQKQQQEERLQKQQQEERLRKQQQEERLRKQQQEERLRKQQQEEELRNQQREQESRKRRRIMQLETEKIDAEKMRSTLTYERSKIQADINEIELKKQNALDQSMLNKKCSIVIALGIVSCLGLGIAAFFPLAYIVVIVGFVFYIKTSITMLKNGGYHRALIWVNLVTYGLFSIIMAIVIKNKVKNQLIEASSLDYDLDQLNMRMRNMNSRISEVDNKINSIESDIYMFS